ncbi:12S seed storage protein CRB-like [Nicotiana tabacum]|uniref:12S seed storage protein CRB-like n=1 Tax=Nicotiana tabacum TaxID=4097 RepID=A0A1S4CS79_TOBAC|nr:PREDICTED: legumin A-like [Nicotiana tabacum]
MGDCSTGAMHGIGGSIESSSSQNCTSYIEFLPVKEENTDIEESCIGKGLDSWGGFRLHYVWSDLSVRMRAKMVYEGEGGGYSEWCPKEHEVLQDHNIGAAKLVLSTNGFALPCYSDSAKVAYVLQGSGILGVVLPGQEEKLVAIRKGDAIALPVGVVTWWYNKDVTELEILFLGDTKTAVKLGSFTDFLLKGSNSNNLSCFSPEFIGRAWKSDKSVLKTLIGPHLARSIVKLNPGFEISEAELKDYRDGMLLNCEETAPSRFDTDGGGEILDLNTENLAIIGDIGLGASRATLNGNAAYYPEISVDPAIRVTYIIKGSGTVKVRDFGGFVTDRQIEAGELFVVPRLLSVCKIADPDGMEWFSIVCNENSNNYLTLGRWGLISDGSIPKSSSSPGSS